MKGRPNIILLMADEHRHDCAGFAGNPQLRTPNLDALARHGIHFVQTICQFPKCRPSRATLLTGRYPSMTGVVDNETPLPDDAVVFPQLLRQNGYKTGCVGQMNFTPTYPRYGFDTMKLAEQDKSARTEDDYHRWLNVRGAVDQIDEWDQIDRDNAPEEYWDTFGAMTSTLPAALHSTTWIGNQAVRFLQTAREPFFLWTGFNKPHHPFDPPKPWDKVYDPDVLDLPADWCFPPKSDELYEEGHFDPLAMTEEKFRRVLAHYYGAISHVDNQIGRIMATLNSRGYTNNVVIYCSDHGDYMGQHGFILKGHGPPLDSVLRVPLLIAGMTDQIRGARDSSPVELTDLPATLLDIAGLDVPDTMMGQSLMPLLKGTGLLDRDAAYAEAPMNTQIVRTARYKLIESQEESRRAFYDLQNDPHEFLNLYDRPHVSEAQGRMARILEGRQESPLGTR